MKLEFGELDGSSLIALKYFLILPDRILPSHTFQFESPFSSEIKFCKRADHITWWPCWPNDIYNNHDNDILKKMINDEDNILQTRRSHDLVALLANYGSILYIVAFFPVIYVLNRSLRGAMLMCMWVLIFFFNYVSLREAPWLDQYLGNVLLFFKVFFCWLIQSLGSIIKNLIVASCLGQYVRNITSPIGPSRCAIFVFVILCNTL